MSQFKKHEVVILPTCGESKIHRRNEKMPTNPVFTERDLSLIPKKGTLQFHENPVKQPDNIYWGAQHLYILSDNRIELGDWYINPWGNGKPLLTECDSEKEETELRTIHALYNTCKKVIASTDPSLVFPYAKTKCKECGGNMIVHTPDHLECTSCNATAWDLVNGVHNEIQRLPNIPDWFIKKYCEVGGIAEVKLKYEDKGEEVFHGDHGNGCYRWEPNWQLKLIPNNTITIKLIKESWNKGDINRLKEKLKHMHSGPWDGWEHGARQGYRTALITIENWIEENL